MNEIQFSTSDCRHCRFYEPEGRRGGSCQMLGVPVQGRWKACPLASSPFDTTLKKLEDIFQLETSMPLNSPVRLASKVANIEMKSDASHRVGTPKDSTERSLPPFEAEAVRR